jgi:hypothetical protein
MREWNPGDRVRQGTRHGTVESVSQYSGKIFVRWDGGLAGNYVSPAAIEPLQEDPTVHCGGPSVADTDESAASWYPLC